jgi:hypothetical protein
MLLTYKLIHLCVISFDRLNVSEYSVANFYRIRLGDNAGFSIYRDSVDKSFHFHSEVDSSYVDSNGTTVRFKKHIGLNISKVASRFTLQRMFGDICHHENLLPLSCGQLVAEFFLYAYDKLYSDTSASLPQIQFVPSPQNPFVFLHFEKSAGTTLRE